MFLLVYYFSSNDVAVTLSFDSDRLSLIGQNIKDTKLSIVQLIFQFCMVFFQFLSVMSLPKAVLSVRKTTDVTVTRGMLWSDKL